MNAGHEHGESSRPLKAQQSTGTLIAWISGSGDSQQSHIMHIGPEGLTWALGLPKAKEFGQLVGETNARPAEAASLIEAHKRGRRLSREQLTRVNYCKALGQLTIIDDAGKKQNILNGSEGEQEQIFEAVSQHLGGTASEEDADAWSVLKGPLLALVVTAFFGVLATYLAADADPNYEPTGRRSGMKKLLNVIAYKVGPTWMAVIFGAVGLIILVPMISRLLKRPKRQTLAF